MVAAAAPIDKNQFGATNTAYLPPPPTASVLNTKHSAAPLDKRTLAILAQRFADGVPEEEFSVAALQGYLLKYKAQPDAAANGVEDWVVSEREMRERLKREKEAREVREKALRERRKKEAQTKAEEKKTQEKKDAELEKVKARLAEKEKEEELEKMRQQLREKEREEAERKKKEAEEEEKKKAESVVTETKVVAEPGEAEEVRVVESDVDSDEENVAPQSAVSSSASSSWGEVP